MTIRPGPLLLFAALYICSGSAGATPGSAGTPAASDGSAGTPGAPIGGASAGPVSAADYARAESFLPDFANPLVLDDAAQLHWLSNDTLWYERTTRAGRDFVWVDPRRGGTRALFDQRRVAAALTLATGKPHDGARLAIRGLEIDADDKGIRFEADGRHWSCSAEGRCAELDARVADEAPSPDRRQAALIRDHNLWVRDLRDGTERALTRDGAESFGYATDNPGWEHSNHAIVAWSPDSRRIATYQQDERGVGDAYLIRTQPGRPTLETWKYPMAGDAVVATLQRVVIDVPTGRVVRLDMPPDAHRSSVCYDVQCGGGRFADVQWSDDSARLAFVSTSRDHKRVVLREADASTGRVRTLLTEESPTYYESDLSSTDHGAVNWCYLPRAHRIIWFSERSGYAHLYLYDLDSGRLLQPITEGRWNVVEILHVDEARRLIYFMAVGREAGRDPYFEHLYRVGFNGRGLELLTPENANHEITFAASGRLFADRYSTPQTPPVTIVRDDDGKLVRTITKADAGPLEAAGWKPPTSITVKARDGTTDLYGLLFVPTHFDPAKKYPIITWVYPGPHTGSVGSRSFSAAREDRQSLAELGFIVVAVDGMGTPFRSKAFHDVSYGHMRDNTLPDQVAALRQLAQRYAWIDLDRAGIYGHSGGGYAATTAMLLYPDVFKVAVAESGNHDPAGYTDDWAEKFQGLPVREADGRSSYDAESNIPIADRLRGHLLLMHGTMDDNVPPNLTLLLVDALIRANKDFDLIMLPNQHHEYRGAAERYAIRRRWDYFVRYLQGVEPPHEYPMRTPPEALD